ncbi:hypothetical protein AMTR_s00009p00221430 [Amborella trichopoda]|uniref:Uncharacterized protein n=1 Tax=Amborella trichopoda TaxID=13333 RepID=W1NHJ9_AMBTC|nr:hypothetical protein AMTR_s00009p00221430 [Amborella trichopoda]
MYFSGKGAKSKGLALPSSNGDRGFITPRFKDLDLVHLFTNLGLPKSRFSDITSKSDQHEKLKDVMLKVSKSMTESLASKYVFKEPLAGHNDKRGFSNTGSKAGAKGDEDVQFGAKRKLPFSVAAGGGRKGYGDGEKRSKGNRVYPTTPFCRSKAGKLTRCQG